MKLFSLTTLFLLATIISAMSPVIASGTLPEEDGQTSSIQTKRVTNPQPVYTVAEGDSLWTIAEKVYGDGYAWQRLAKLNKIESPDYIEIGQKLNTR